MAQIIIVQTGDGPVFFRPNNRDKLRATDMAYRMVMSDDYGNYLEEDRLKCREAYDNSDWKLLYERLIDCYAIKTADFQ